MLFWTLLWVAIAAFIVCFFLWSTYTLYEQKKVWKIFAKKANVRYEKGGLFESPSVSGQIGEFVVSVSSDAKETPDMRGQRYVSAIDIQIGEGMPTAAAFGTQDTREFMEALVIQNSYIPKFKGWKNEYFLKARNLNIIKTYLTEDRLAILTSLFSMKGYMVLFIFDEIDCVLRIETGDPLVKKGQLENLVKKMIAAGKRLQITDEEKKIFASMQNETDKEATDDKAETEPVPEPVEDVLEKDEELDEELFEDDKE